MKPKVLKNVFYKLVKEKIFDRLIEKENEILKLTGDRNTSYKLLSKENYIFYQEFFQDIEKNLTKLYDKFLREEKEYIRYFIDENEYILDEDIIKKSFKYNYHFYKDATSLHRRFDKNITEDLNRILEDFSVIEEDKVKKIISYACISIRYRFIYYLSEDLYRLCEEVIDKENIV